MLSRWRLMRWQNPRGVKADSGRRVVARRIGAAAAALTLLAGCGGGGSPPRTVPPRAVDALQGVAAHRLADAPGRNRPPAWRGPHPVAVRPLSVARDGLYGRWYAPKDLHAATPGLVVFGGSTGGLRTTALARAFASYGYPALALAYFRSLTTATSRSSGSAARS